ncbi:MAG: hypothetical protein ABSC94_14940 [Polyangiaceae bacterium]|jgi:D-alanine-D-alanine ligase-like ATP-grasp enzyme
MANGSDEDVRADERGLGTDVNLSRRSALTVLVGAGLAFGCGNGDDSSSATPTSPDGSVGGATDAAADAAAATGDGALEAAGDSATCAVTPEGEIGPYFADDSTAGFARSLITSNLDGTSTQPGVALTLQVTVIDAQNGCVPYVGAQVDIWHCNASGVYLDIDAEGTSSDKWLRGYQLTDAKWTSDVHHDHPRLVFGANDAHSFARPVDVQRGVVDERRDEHDPVFLRSDLRRQLYTTVAPRVLRGEVGDIDMDSELKRRWERDLYSWSLVRACISEARARDIPVSQRWYDCVPVLELGYGVKRQRIVGPVSEVDSGTSIMLGSNKLMGRALLQQLHIPFPPGAAVANLRGTVEMAERLGYEVVLKTPTGSNSTGLVTSIKNREQLSAAYDYLRRRYPGGPLLLEKMLIGRYFRVLVVDGKAIRVSTGWASEVTADGEQNVRALLASHRRHHGDDVFDYRLEGLLLSQGLALDSVPAKGTTIKPTPVTANWAHCEGTVHPRNIATFEAIGRALGPSVIGIDVIAETLDTPLVANRSSIVEFNAGPGFFFHDNVPEIWRLLLTRLFPIKSTGRVPVICVVGPGPKAASSIETPIATEGRASDVVMLSMTESEFWEAGLPFDLCDTLIISGPISRSTTSLIIEAIKPGGALVVAPGCDLEDEVHNTLQSQNIFWRVAIPAPQPA